MKNIILTGVGGFIGSHCLEYFLDKTDWNIIGIDSFRHKGTYSRLNEVSNFSNDRVKIYHHDLSVPVDEQLQKRIDKVDYIINMASDSAVERSTSDPVACLRNNSDLAINMLELARKLKPEIFFHISTDEVYGDAKIGESHKEWSTILPSNPYSASKAAQEAYAYSYWRTFGIPVVITNTMNNIGEWQDCEKFLPKLIRLIATGQEMPIYADSEKEIGTRFYLHAKNHADALVFLSKRPPALYENGAERPDRYNVCGDVELNNLEFAQLVAKLMDKPLKYKLVKSESARKGYDRRYALDGSKMKDLGWVPPIGFEESLEKIIKWTLDNPHWI